MRAGLKNRRAMGDGDGDGMAWPRSAPWAVAVLSFSSDGMAMACRCSTAQRALQWQREQQGHQHGPSWQQPLIIMLIIAVGGGGRRIFPLSLVAPTIFIRKLGGADASSSRPAPLHSRPGCAYFLGSVLFLSQVLPSTTCSRTSFLTIYNILSRQNITKNNHDESPHIDK